MESYGKVMDLMALTKPLTMRQLGKASAYVDDKRFEVRAHVDTDAVREMAMSFLRTLHHTGVLVLTWGVEATPEELRAKDVTATALWVECGASDDTCAQWKSGMHTYRVWTVER